MIFSYDRNDPLKKAQSEKNSLRELLIIWTMNNGWPFSLSKIPCSDKYEIKPHGISSAIDIVLINYLIIRKLKKRLLENDKEKSLSQHGK